MISQCLMEEYAPISSTIKFLDGPCQDETRETHPIWVFWDVADASKAMDALNAILIVQDSEVATPMGSEMDTESSKSRTEIALPWWAAPGALYETYYRRASPKPYRKSDALASPICRILSAATETIFSIAEVYESQKPYGMLPGDPPTYVSTVRTANCVTHACNVPPTAQQTIDGALSKPKAVQMAEKCFILDMKRALASDESILQETCWYVTHRFKAHLPIPEFWAGEYPTVVVLWRASQKQQVLADIWCQWAMTQHLHTWTDVPEVTIISFLQDLQVLLSGMITSMHRALPLLLSLWTTLKRVSGCIVCREGSPLGPHANVSVVRTEDMQPFIVPTPAEPQTYCVYPRMTQVDRVVSHMRAGTARP